MASNEQALIMQAEPQITMATEPTLNFPSGDVIILMKNPNGDETIIEAKVSSHALSIASPVWKKFLYPPWATKSSKPVDTIDCFGDDPEALTILLNIAHLKFRLVPKQRLSYPGLLQMAILVDQYDCIELVQPWLDLWLGNDERRSQKPGKEEWLFLAWVFGRDNVFAALANNFVSYSKLSLG